MKKQSYKRIIFGLIICITLIGLFVLLNSYALWRSAKMQNGLNSLISDCLEVELEETGVENLSLDNAWPISDDAGMALPAYTFNVVNKCQKEERYQVVLDSLAIDNTGNEMDSLYVKFQLNNSVPLRYSPLDDANTNGLKYTPLESKIIYTGTVPASTDNEEGYVEHSIKIWISEDAPNSEIGKEFYSKVRIIAGQGLPEPDSIGFLESASYRDVTTPEDCFYFDKQRKAIVSREMIRYGDEIEMTDNNTYLIFHYDDGFAWNECSTESLIIPPAIDGYMVKKYDFNVNNYCSNDLCSINWGNVDLTKAIGLEEITGQAFEGYIGTNQDLIIPDNIKIINGPAFRNFNGNSVTIGSGLDNISSGLFYCFNGNDLIIPNNIKTIGERAFYNYHGNNLSLGSNIETIGDEAFYLYNGNDLVLNDGLQTIENSAFASYIGSGRELIIPDSVGVIGQYAFFGFNGSNLKLGSKLQFIGPYSFDNYQGIININMTQSNFSKVIKNSSKASGFLNNDNYRWKNDSATLNYLQ